MEERKCSVEGPVMVCWCAYVGVMDQPVSVNCRFSLQRLVGCRGNGSCWKRGVTVFAVLVKCLVVFFIKISKRSHLLLSEALAWEQRWVHGHIFVFEVWASVQPYKTGINTILNPKLCCDWGVIIWKWDKRFCHLRKLVYNVALLCFYVGC